MYDKKIAVIGLGYVGLPLAIEFGKKYQVLGYDINQERVEELNCGEDHTLEADLDGLKMAMDLALTNQNIGLKFSHDEADLKPYNVYIVTVPTPIDKNNSPDLQPLINASTLIGKVISKGDIVIYESTTYPGCTEEDCVPVIEDVSGLRFNKDFFVGYSPERINPGDKNHTVEKIKKVTSGSTPEIGELVDKLYASIIVAGTHLAPSIKVAEAAKVIENSQRDINIAFVNELSRIFNKMGIDTYDVLEAASTKWNFLNFKPGLVGGHCIGVDPYYLAQRAQRFGYHPEIILAGRKLNDGMGEYVASQTVKLMLKKNIPVINSHILILGITFKENCPDVRNTRVVDIIKTLGEYHVNVDVCDPWADPEEVKQEYGLDLHNDIPDKKYDAIILAVAHHEYADIDIEAYRKERSVVFDVKGCLNPEIIDGRL